VRAGCRTDRRSPTKKGRHRTGRDTLVELPLAWYAEKKGYWAMNPGYDRPNHDGFRRTVTYDCMLEGGPPRRLVQREPAFMQSAAS
jgi:hypothetical protein